MLNSDGTVTCDYCGKPADLVPSMDGRHIWQCLPCDAWVAAYESSPTKKPLGRLANAELREAKKAANRAFEPVWKPLVVKALADSGGRYKGKGRGDAYRWLAAELGIDVKDCDFCQFDVATCYRVIEIVRTKVPPFLQGTK